MMKKRLFCLNFVVAIVMMASCGPMSDEIVLQDHAQTATTNSYFYFMDKNANPASGKSTYVNIEILRDRWYDDGLYT